MLRKWFGTRRGDDWRRIRKDAGVLTRSDFEEFPAWEFCLDEEGAEGQTESTMRPARPTPPVSLPDFYGGLAADIAFADGTRHLGVIWPTSADPSDLWKTECNLWLPKRAQELTQRPLPTTYNPLIMADSLRLSFSLPPEKFMSRDEARRLIDLAYSVIGGTRGGVWPLVITPRLRVAGWPDSWSVHGWRRYAASERDSEVLN